MAPNIHTARLKVGYPLYAADFDPLNYDFLLVGGGGGSSATGVPNKITLLDTSKKASLQEVSDLELAKDEDSVVSLAVAQSDAQSLLAYAGINGSSAEQKSGKNEHFRSFRVGLPAKRKRGEPSSEAQSVTPPRALSKSALFRSATSPQNDCYQRVLRLSPPVIEGPNAILEGEEHGTERKLQKRLVALASGLGPHNEVLTLPAVPAPTNADVMSRIGLEKEAGDVDIINVEDEKYPHVLAYCTDNELFLQRLSREKAAGATEPQRVYEIPKGPGSSKIRALRWLTPHNILLVQNRPARSGVDLVVVRVTKDYAEGQQASIKGLQLKQVVGLDAVALSSAADGSQQFVVAVGGVTGDIQLLTLDWTPLDGLSKFKVYTTLPNVHDGPPTRLTWSNFIPPAAPISSQTPPQYLKLASVSVDQTVVVHTLPLLPYPDAGTGEKNPQYVITAPFDLVAMVKAVFVSVMTLLVVGLLLISVIEVRGGIPPMLGVTQYLPERWQQRFAKPYLAYHGGTPGPVIPESMPEVESIIDHMKLADAHQAIKNLEDMQTAIPSLEEVQDTLSDLVSRKESDDDATDKHIIIRDLEDIGGDLSTELRHGADVVKDSALKKWDELTPHEKTTWKQKLQKAGHWTEKQGETILKGVLFSELAGIVGAAVRGG